MGRYRNLVVLAVSTVILAAGQQLWFGYLPNYLRALGAGALALGMFASLQDLLSALYHYPGGWLDDRFGLRAGLVLASLGAGLGYLVFLASPHFVPVFLGLPLVMLWPAMAAPATTKLLAESLPPWHRLTGAVLEVTVARLPGLIAPIAGGLLINQLGVTTAIRIGLGATFAAAAVAAGLQGLGLRPAPGARTFPAPWHLLLQLPHGLKRLLVAEVLVGYAEALPRIWIAIYAIEVMGAPYWGLGLLLAAEALAVVLAGAPLRWLAGIAGPKAVLIAAYLATAVTPMAILLAPGWMWLFAGFCIAGLGAGGRAVRDTILGTLAQAESRGQQVGLYESIRSLLILPAGLIGSAFWLFVGPWMMFVLALFAGLMGCFVYAAIGPAPALRHRG